MALPTISPKESGALRWGQRSVSTATAPSCARKMTIGSLQIVRASGFAPSSVEIAAVYHRLRRDGGIDVLPRRPPHYHNSAAAAVGRGVTPAPPLPRGLSRSRARGVRA